MAVKWKTSSNTNLSSQWLPLKCMLGVNHRSEVVLWKSELAVTVTFSGVLCVLMVLDGWQTPDLSGDCSCVRSCVSKSLYEGTTVGTKNMECKNLGLCSHLLESLTAFVFLCNVQQSGGWIILLFPVLSMQRIGDSYRGYCVSETELESVLTLHKQQTQSVWGTRQSPSPAKPATRLMWKSQYVPYDGIPFVNAGN